nr:hypothetical protein [Tanacetum cinerariifolium]
AGYGGAQNIVGNANPGQARQIMCYNCNGMGHIARNCTQPKRPHNSKYFKDKMLLMQAQENEVALDEEQLLFIAGQGNNAKGAGGAGGHINVVDEDVDEPLVQDLALNVDNVFEANKSDAFESDVDEAPTAQTMFMTNLSSADLIYDKANRSYDSNILYEVQDHDNYQDAVYEHHEVHEMHDDVQPNCVVDSDAEYMSDSNMIPYDQYVKNNAEPVIQSNVSSVPNDAYMMILNEMHEHAALCISTNEQNKVVNALLTAELARYKEQVKLYERRAKFELTERERKIDEQLRIGIQKALIKEVKEMKEIFKELEAEVDQNVVNWKYDEIERKNLLITNDNLTADCLSKEVFYIATNSELTISRFSEMHDAHTVVQAHCLELEAELSKLKDKIQKDDHNEMVKCFSNLETTILLTENENIKAQINEKMKCDTIDSIKLEVLAPEEASVVRPLDRSLASAFLYTKQS